MNRESECDRLTGSYLICRPFNYQNNTDQHVESFAGCNITPCNTAELPVKQSPPLQVTHGLPTFLGNHYVLGTMKILNIGGFRFDTSAATTDNLHNTSFIGKRIPQDYHMHVDIHFKLRC